MVPENPHLRRTDDRPPHEMLVFMGVIHGLFGVMIANFGSAARWRTRVNPALRVLYSFFVNYLGLILNLDDVWRMATPFHYLAEEYLLAHVLDDCLDDRISRYGDQHADESGDISCSKHHGDDRVLPAGRRPMDR